MYDGPIFVVPFSFLVLQFLAVFWGKKALRKAYGQQRHQEILARMATYDANKDSLSLRSLGSLGRRNCQTLQVAEFSIPKKTNLVMDSNGKLSNG